VTVLVGPGLIDLSAYPQVVAEQPRRSFGRDALPVLGVALALLGAGIVYRHFHEWAVLHMIARLRRSLIAVIAIVGVSGCSAAVRHPARAPMITLRSPTSFRLHALDSAQAGCQVVRADVQITAVRGDTLFLAAATPTNWPYAAPRCALAGPGFVRVADHPDVQTDRIRRSMLLGQAWRAIIAEHTGARRQMLTP